MYNNEELTTQLSDLLFHINEQIVHVVDQADELGIPATKMQYPDGTWVMSDLLSAKASALNALDKLRRE